MQAQAQVDAASQCCHTTQKSCGRPRRQPPLTASISNEPLPVSVTISTLQAASSAALAAGEPKAEGGRSRGWDAAWHGPGRSSTWRKM